MCPAVEGPNGSERIAGAVEGPEDAPRPHNRLRCLKLLFEFRFSVRDDFRAQQYHVPKHRCLDKVAGFYL